MKIDHIAISVDSPREAAIWYAEKFNGNITYSDDTWSSIEFENINLSFVIKEQHPAHFAFRVDKFDVDDVIKIHRDGTHSSYKKDPWGNIYELIKYPGCTNV